MRFSENGYYVDKYVKCSNCGMLIFDQGIRSEAAGSNLLFCSDWCTRWWQGIQAGQESPRIALPRRADAVEPDAGAPLDVNINVIESALVAICREMGINLMKTSYSPIFNEAEDFSCALATPDGEMIANGEFCPAQIGGVPLLVRSMIQETNLASMREGDVIVHNDPFRGGLHTPEHTVFKPIFFDGELIAFAVAIGHFVEVGGMSPGGFPGDATDAFQEGLRIPPVKIIKQGQDDPELWKMLLAQVRQPRLYHGDLRAMISAVDLAEARVKDLIRKYGKEELKDTVKGLLDYSERRTRAEILAIPDGVYRFEDVIEDDGIDRGKSHRIKIAVHVQGDQIVIDYTGTGPQARGPINATLGVAWSAAYNALLHITDESIPKNSGCFRPIKVIAPGGTLVNVDFPGASVGGNTETHPVIVGTIFGALAHAVPNRVMASEGTTHGCFTFGGFDARLQEPFGGFEFAFVGYGGRAFADGNDATDSINGNCNNTPVEVFEARFPIMIEEYALRQGAGGAGRHRGGLPTSKTYRALGPVSVSQMTNRHQEPAWGLHGGGTGQCGATHFQVGGKPEWQTAVEAFGRASTSKYSNIMLQAGDRVRVDAPGGGGYGNPAERDRRAVIDDVREGFITREAAKRDYGFQESWLAEDAAGPERQAS